MKADSKHNFVLVLIGLTIILSIYLIVTNKEKFTALQEYKKKILGEFRLNQVA